MPLEKSQKTCSKGHIYFKSSDCPVCPICAKHEKPESGFLSLLSAPARRALQGRGIDTLKKLSRHSEKEILQLHGMGPGTIPTLQNALKEAGLKFRV